MTERINRVVEDCLRTFVNHKQSNWDELLPLCQFAINNSDQTSTGESPFFLNTGQHPLTPSSLIDACTSLDLAGERSGQWLKITTNAFRLDLPHQLKCHPVFNITALKKFHQNEFEGRYTPPPPPITDRDGFECYIVEKMMDHKRTRRGTKFLVKWVGYPDATWEPEEFLKNEIGEDLEHRKEYKEAVGSCV